MQTTLKTKAKFTGIGLHTGRPVRMFVSPALADTGIVFRRTDVTGADPVVPARWNLVDRSPLNTRIVNSEGTFVSTVEHLMAALAGCGIHNALVELDGPEVPILDGSAAGFVRGLLRAGIVTLNADLVAIEVLRPVEVRQDGAAARLDPAAGLVIDFTIDFPDPAIGRQCRTLDLGNGAFVRNLCDSRTFCRIGDVEAMHANGLGLGGTMENAVVVDGDRVLSPGGFRHADEAVRHKMLDALGDLATAGAPILGRYTAFRAGHAVTNGLLRKLFADDRNWRMVVCGPDRTARLPGVGVSPADLAAVA